MAEGDADQAALSFYCKRAEVAVADLASNECFCLGLEILCGPDGSAEPCVVALQGSLALLGFLARLILRCFALDVVGELVGVVCWMRSISSILTA